MNVEQSIKIVKSVSQHLENALSEFMQKNSGTIPNNAEGACLVMSGLSAFASITIDRISNEDNELKTQLADQFCTAVMVSSCATEEDLKEMADEIKSAHDQEFH